MNEPEFGERVVAILGEPAAREFLDVLTRPEAARAEVIGRLYSRADTTELAEALIELESDPDDLSRLRLIDELERALGLGGGAN
jgi:hypothetical protein